MEKTHLIQRLKKPFKKGNPFCFGGQTKNRGGIDKLDYELLKKIWRFDYMGSAEFEFGAIPKALNFIKENAKGYVLGKVNLPFIYEPLLPGKNISGNKDVFYICREEDEKEVTQRLALWAKNDSPYSLGLKEQTEFPRSLASTSKDESYSICYGWLELENHFMFFTDFEMFYNTVCLFTAYNEDFVPELQFWENVYKNKK